MGNKNHVIALLLILIAAGVALADTITTPVRFVIPTALTFTISIPAGNGTIFNASQTTTTIIFNTTATTAVKLNATNSPGGAAVQTATAGIFNYTNTGNVLVNITVNFSLALPTGVTVKAGWADGGYESACTGNNLSSTTTCTLVNANTNQTRIANLSTSGAGSWRSVWLWADYSSVAIGTDSTVNLVHTSVAG